MTYPRRAKSLSDFKIGTLITLDGMSYWEAVVVAIRDAPALNSNGVRKNWPIRKVVKAKHHDDIGKVSGIQGAFTGYIILGSVNIEEQQKTTLPPATKYMELLK